MTDLVDRLEAMFQLEKSVYKTDDYLDPLFQKKLALISNADFPEQFSSNTASLLSLGINDVWREKICEWSYQVVDHFDFSREVVSISMHYLDRYLATRPVSKKIFQLAAMTTLYLAIKLFESGRLTMSTMIELSRGYFTVDQMVSMESLILKSLDWHVHPPSAFSFCKHIFFLLPHKSISMDLRHDILELARFLTELSVIDYYFVVHRPSVVAYAALVNAMEIIPGAMVALPDFTEEVKNFVHLHIEDEAVRECRTRLRLLYAQGAYSRQTGPAVVSREQSISPVCVSYGCQPHDMVYSSYEPSDF